MQCPIYYIMDAEAWSQQRQWPASGLIALRINPARKQALQMGYQKLQEVDSGLSFCLCLTVIPDVDE